MAGSPSSVRFGGIANFAQWRAAARPFLAARVAPDRLDWSGASVSCREPAAAVPGLRDAASARGGTVLAPSAAPSAPAPGAATPAPGAATPAPGAATPAPGAAIPAPGAAFALDAAATAPSAAAAPGAIVVGPNAGAVDAPPPRISAAVLGRLETLALYRDDGRWDLMYRLAWRILNENAALLDDSADPDVRHAEAMEREIRRDVHKMHAFVRFRERVDEQGATAYFAWFEPKHEILRRGAQFFVKRFVNTAWTIATPDGAAVWDLSQLHFIDSPPPSQRPREDAYEDLWRTYYKSICNVARINPAAMQREMPQRYWKHLPEAAEIGLLIRDGAADFAQRHRETENEGIAMVKAVKRALPPAAEGETPQTCQRCDLWKHATQAVSGEGAAAAKIMLVGEQPGDEEDLRGRPFVGPAGRVLDEAIAAAGLTRARLFITNAVKHFKWEPRGKRRLHKKPGAAEINACHVWLERDVADVKPVVIVALGATALRALTGATLSIEAARREELRDPGGARILATYHPSAILRAEGERAEQLRAALVSDLATAARLASPDE